MLYFISMSENNRPTWEEYFKNIVLLTSKRSSCDRLKVGCLFIKNNRIIAQGYNGYIAGCQHTAIIKDNHNIATIHAEQNAITDCAKRGVSSNGATAYITHFPCYNCTKLMISSGICKINYIEDYKNDILSKELAESVNIEIKKLT